MECCQKRKRSENRSTVNCLWKCLEEKTYPHALKWCNREKLMFSVFFRRKGTDGWDERDLDFFKELDSLSPSKKAKYFEAQNHNIKCKERGRNNLQKLCKDKIIKLEEEVSEKENSHSKYFKIYKFLAIPNVKEVDDISPVPTDDLSMETNMARNKSSLETEIRPIVGLPYKSQGISQAYSSDINISDPETVFFVDLKSMPLVEEVEITSSDQLIDLGYEFPGSPGVSHPVVLGVSQPVVSGVSHPVVPGVSHPVVPRSVLLQPKDVLGYGSVDSEKDHLYCQSYDFLNQMDLDKLDPSDIYDVQSQPSGEDFNLIDYICSPLLKKESFDWIDENFENPFCETDESLYSEISINGLVGEIKSEEFEEFQTMPVWTSGYASIFEEIKDIEALAEEL